MAVSFCFLRPNLKTWQFISQETICSTIRHPPKAAPNGFLTPMGIWIIQKIGLWNNVMNLEIWFIFPGHTCVSYIWRTILSSFWTFYSKRVLEWWTHIFDNTSHYWGHVIAQTMLICSINYEAKMWKMNV